MKLPELSADASPEFTDAATGKAWLEHVPLANVATAQANLLEQLQEFNRFPTAAAPRLAVLEGLREAVHFVQIEQAKRFANRALPMTDQENAAFDTTIALWDQMGAGYQRCLDGAIHRDAGMRAQAALVCQRLLAYIGLRMFHHYRAYRQVPGDDWRALHEAYAAAEKLDVADDGVKDFLNRDIQDTSPRVAYARGVLMGLCNPNELAQRQLTFVAYLLERWGAKLEVETKPVDEGEGVPPLVADLASDVCPERGAPASTPAREPRYLDLRKLAKSLRNRVALLRKGESPAKLALGEDCVQPTCEQLLVYLYRQWCQPKAARATDRRTSSAPAEACMKTFTFASTCRFSSIVDWESSSQPCVAFPKSELVETQPIAMGKKAATNKRLIIGLMTTPFETGVSASAMPRAIPAKSRGIAPSSALVPQTCHRWGQSVDSARERNSTSRSLV